VNYTTKRHPWAFCPELIQLENREQPGSAWPLSWGLGLLENGLPLLNVDPSEKDFRSPQVDAAVGLNELLRVPSGCRSPAATALVADDWTALNSLPAVQAQPISAAAFDKGPGNGMPPDRNVPVPGYYYIDYWYNGDFDGRSELPNGWNTTVQDARVYDNFYVDGPRDPICLCRLWSDDFMDFWTCRANWEIRTGVSEHNPGILVASGFNVPAEQIPTGRSFNGLPEYTIAVDLTFPVYIYPDEYWLCVTPVGRGTGHSFISTTSGMNGYGDPPGNDGNSFIDSPSLGYQFERTENVLGQGTWDFSEGLQIMPMGMGKNPSSRVAPGPSRR
jgi:hypothetical protein